MAAEVVAREGAAMTVALVKQGGARLTLPARAGVGAGDRLVVGVRPEHFVAAGQGDCDLTVAVDVTEHLGSTSYVYANTKIGEQLIVERDRSRGGDRPGPAHRLDTRSEGLCVRCRGCAAEVTNGSTGEASEMTNASEVRWGKRLRYLTIVSGPLLTTAVTTKSAGDLTSTGDGRSLSGRSSSEPMPFQAGNASVRLRSH